MALDDILLEAEETMSNSVDYLKSELRGIRTGRASTAIVEHIRVDYYGASTEIRQLATLSIPEPNLIVIKPFDISGIKDIEKAIQAANIGITPMSDGRMIRLTVPPLSGERRTALAGQVRKLGEASKVTIRNVRRDANKQLEKEQKEGLIPEDDAKRGKEDTQELTKQYEGKVDEALDAKIAEIEQV